VATGFRELRRRPRRRLTSAFARRWPMLCRRRVVVPIRYQNPRDEISTATATAAVGVWFVPPNTFPHVPTASGGGLQIAVCNAQFAVCNSPPPPAATHHPLLTKNNLFHNPKGDRLWLKRPKPSKTPSCRSGCRGEGIRALAADRCHLIQYPHDRKPGRYPQVPPPSQARGTAATCRRGPWNG